MNSVLYMIVSNMAIVCCLLPFLMLFSKKMRQVTTYRVLGIYWLLNGLIHFTDIYFFTSYRNTRLDQLSDYYNILDTPLVLLIFICAAAGRYRKALWLTLMLFISLEVWVVAWKGYAFTSSFLFTAGGVLLVTIYSIIGLLQYMRKMEYTAFESSMVVVYAAMLFAYGSFLIISLFLHVRGNGEINTRDSYLLYYISLLISAIITFLGLWSYGIRRHPRIAT